MTSGYGGPQGVVLDLNEAARALRISRSTVKRLIGEGKLRNIRIGRRVLIPIAALEELIGSGTS